MSVLKYLNDTQTARLWAKIKAGFVSKSGDTMTGALTLAGDPVSDLQAATKKYVDDNAGGAGDIFIAEFGVATASEIADARASGKAVYVTNSTGYAWLVTSFTQDSTEYIIKCVYSDGRSTFYINRSTGSWSSGATYDFAKLSSPAFTGTPTAPTAASGTGTTQIATTAFVQDALESVDALPSQTGKSGKFLTTDGTDASWGTVAVPTKVSDLQNDAGYITGYTETDPTVPSWAKESSKPSYTAGEVGAVPTTRKVNGKALSSDITLSASDVSALPSSTSIPSKTSDLTNDSGFITDYTETDPTVPSWAKQSTKPSYTASEVGAVPTTRTVNGKALSADITLSASDVSALPSSTTIPTASTTNPSMDGTASYGSGTSYARSNHVHPTDTSRQAKITASGLLKGDGSGGVSAATAGTDYAAASHSHGNITSGGDITATAPTIASGDQLVINDNSASKITNGPTFDGSTTTKALTPKGTWETFLTLATLPIYDGTVV